MYAGEKKSKIGQYSEKILTKLYLHFFDLRCISNLKF